MRRILVTSASGANGDGYGTVLSFSAAGDLAGPFSDDPRITDPRGLSLSPAGDLVYVTSGDDRVLALDKNGSVTLDSGRIAGLDAGGGTFAPDGRYCVTLRRRGTILALCQLDSTPKARCFCPTAPSRSHEDSDSAIAASCTCPPV